MSLARVSRGLLRQLAGNKLDHRSMLFHTRASVLLTNKNQESSEAKETAEGAAQTPISDAELKQLKDKLTKFEADAADMKDKYIRSLAEIENTRFRMNKQIEDAKVFGIQGFCRDLLEVADVLRLAITNTDPSKDASVANSSTVEKEKLVAMYNGLVMTETCLLKIFNKHKLVQINPADGEKFDPNQHEAIFRMPVEGKQSGTVNICTKIGYKLSERVIRAAQVGVVQ